FPDGHREKRVLFVGRLKYSRHVHVEVVPDQKAETLVRGVVACLEAWGCVPLIWVFDNPKTVRVSPIGHPIVLHDYLSGLAAELNAADASAWVRDLVAAIAPLLVGSVINPS